ncbi:MAG: hypothetical protein FJY85_18425, partial [Deltaproteobacteria bacterium]|nr:hypothetical protein [Deltaproteobacteria bacterium]
ITGITGWAVLAGLGTNDSGYVPVFSDGDKKFRFLMWKVLITFCRIPGIAIIDWSPETLEDDIKRAMEVQPPEILDPHQIVEALADAIPQDQLREICTLLAKRLGLPHSVGG